MQFGSQVVRSKTDIPIKWTPKRKIEIVNEATPSPDLHADDTEMAEILPSRG